MLRLIMALITLFDYLAQYLDPTYVIRSVPANPSDSILCSQLAYNAVHGVFAGFTGFTVGNVRGASILFAH